jgi:hypothetical protein
VTKDNAGSEALRDWIIHVSCGQAKVARATGKSRWAVYAWMCKGAVPDGPTSAVLAQLCGIPPAAWGQPPKGVQS